MNVRDIGRVERCLFTWIPLFKATGKHIYATYLERFFLDLHFKYPEGLRRAIRYNILINPTGKAGKFRAADWLVELHNLDIKTNHGGQGPNYTVKRIIEESSLMATYKSVHEVITHNLALSKTSVLHADPNMEKTIKDLRDHIASYSPHIFMPGRSATYSIPDMMDSGHGAMDRHVGVNGNDADGDGNADDDERPDADDIIGELL
ncbi:hypothetical protein AX14_005299 [Amanita brunnescens Koide BX004]|nr:hypothetical protein AX14_005299 [Amanita brunnescens Koide BX004]